MAKLSQAQQKLFDRIKEVSGEKQASAATRKETHSGWVNSGELKSREFGWNELNIRTVNALAKSGLVSVRVVQKVEETTKAYSFGRKVRHCSYIETHYQFKLVGNNETPSFEYWYGSAVMSFNARNLTFVRNENINRQRYSVYVQ